MSSTTVNCIKLGAELPALPRAPYPGEIGQRIHTEISAQAWDMWKEHAKLLINEYRLNPSEQQARVILREEMEAFLFGKGEVRMAEGYVPPES